MFDSIPDGVVLADAEGRIEYINHAMLEMGGFCDVDAVIGKNVFTLSSLEGRRIATAKIIPALKKTGQWSGNVPIVQKGKETIECELFCVLVRDENSNNDYIVATFKDVTRQSQLEDQLRQSQKLEAIGTLAGGVAHDMNNVLGAILTLSSMLKEDLSGKEHHSQDINGIISAARRGRSLTQDLLGFARKGKYRRERVSINELLEDLKELLSHTLPRTVNIQLLLEDTLPLVEGDHSQLSHAFMNLCLNASDAMGGDGTITCTTRRIAVDNSSSFENLMLSQGSYLLVEIIDSGVGMDATVVKRAMEPFFTTKDPAHGTGLGLPMVYGTVKNHGGAISIESKPGAGTKVSIYLPSATDEKTPKSISTQIKTISPDQSGLVLLVDDEDMIRRSVGRFLLRSGYDVVLACDGVEAVELVRERGNELRLIILDMLMPVMDGEKTFEVIHEIAPEVPVLIASGFVRDGKIERLLDMGVAGFIEKPFELNHLAGEIADLARKI